MEALVPELPEPPKPKRRWLPRFSLRALLFVVFFAALGGSYPAVVVREAADRESREAQAAADELPARWQELKEAVQGFDAETETAFDRFAGTAWAANSDEALRKALGDPDKLGGTQWTLNAATGLDRISVAINYDGRRLQTDFTQTEGSSSSGAARSAPYPDHLRIGLHTDAFVVAASLIGMLAGAGIGLVVWGIQILLRRLWRRFHPDSKAPAAGTSPTSP